MSTVSICEECGNPFQKRWPSEPRRFCSAKCNVTNKQKHLMVTCKQCGATFKKKSSHEVGNFCCRECYDKYRDEQRIPVEKIKEVVYRCSSEYHKRNREKANKRAKIHRRDNPKYHFFNRVKERAKRLGLEFELTIEDIDPPQYCPILGIPLLEMVPGRKNMDPNNPSIDRIDNTKGYTKDNIWFISLKANKLKNNATFDELIALGEWAKMMKQREK